MGLLTWIIVGLIAGWLAGQVMKGGGHPLGHARRDRGWMGVQIIWNPRRRVDRFNHRRLCRSSDSGVAHEADQESLASSEDRPKDRRELRQRAIRSF